MTRLTRLTVTVMVSLLGAAAALGQEDVERFTLDNGLRVTLWPVQSAKTVAVLTLFDIGERHDPVGASGMAHILEHLLCTAATAESEPTTYEALAARYQGQFNAQTGENYTLLALVAPKDELDRELRAAASRLRDLRITQSDLDRELPRVAVELRNMHADIPVLGLMNGAKQAALPMQADARKGGVIEQVNQFTVQDLRARLSKHYGAGSTRLVLVGGFDLEATRARIHELFDDLPTGAPIPAPAQRVPRDPEPVLVEPARHNGARLVCLAFPMPTPADAGYPAAVLIASRLSERWPPSMNPGHKPSVQWTPLDQPEVLFVLAPVEEGETPAQAIARLDDRVRDSALKAADPADAFLAVQRYGMMLGATPLPPFVAAQNPYFAAVVLGRGEQLATQGPELAVRLRKVDDDTLRAAYAAHFSPQTRGAAGVRPAGVPAR